MSATTDLLSQLLNDLEEELEMSGFVALYTFLWTARGLAADRDDSELLPLCSLAVEELRSRHRLRLMWLPWPTDLAQAVPAEKRVALDFDVDDPTDVATPLLALVDVSPFNGN